jgi:dTDP-4-dehydrorhamnose 3,5-epimerase
MGDDVPGGNGASGWRPTSIRGADRRALAPIADARGSFTELWRASWTPAVPEGFLQANLSRSSAGVLRGLHFHERQTDLWLVVEGLASVALVDVRPLVSGDSARPIVEHFDMEAGSATVIPPGVAHGFVAVRELSLLYLVSREYDGTDEFGFAWDDALAGVSWPVPEPILSQRDATNPPLTEAIELVRQRGVLREAR